VKNLRDSFIGLSAASLLAVGIFAGCGSASGTQDQAPRPACQTQEAVAEYKATHDTEPPPPTLSQQDQEWLATKEKMARDYYIAKYGGTPNVPTTTCG
jgi:hypothetical protein